jgi:tRNA-2-methylthio-N6-dimethylallyladenosine synthase
MQERIALEKNREMVGRRVEVLVEGRSKKDAARVTARTRTNKIVHVAAGELVAGTFVDVVIGDAHPHHLDGVLA